MNASSTVFLFVITISLFSSSTIPFVDIVQEADALKSKGTYTRQYGSSTNHIVCGDRLCSEVSSTPVSQKLSEKAQEGLDAHPEEKMSISSTDVAGDKMADVVDSQKIIYGKTIHDDFPIIQTLTVTHANQIDPNTYILEYEVTSGTMDLNVVKISVNSDIETIEAETGSFSSNSKVIHMVIIHAHDPTSITASIQSYN